MNEVEYLLKGPDNPVSWEVVQRAEIPKTWLDGKLCIVPLNSVVSLDRVWYKYKSVEVYSATEFSVFVHFLGSLCCFLWLCLVR